MGRKKTGRGQHAGTLEERLMRGYEYNEVTVPG